MNPGYANLTVKQQAAIAGVSERSMYLAHKLQRHGSPELSKAVQDGELSVQAALRSIGMMDAPCRLKQIKALWPKLTAEEQREFWRWIEYGN